MLNNTNAGKMRGARLATLVVLAVTPGFSSTIIAYTTPSTTQITGNQSWFGSLGMDFEVLKPIVVSQIGVFSNNAFGHATAAPRTNLNAAIFSMTTSFDATTGDIIPGTEASFVAPPNSATDPVPYEVKGNWLFQDITPVVLLPGFYTIVAQGYNALDMNGNQFGASALPLETENTGGGLITFGGGSRYENAFPSTLPNPVHFPSTLDGGPSARYYAGNFEFDAAPTPEPASFLLFGGGLLGLSLMLRRRRKA